MTSAALRVLMPSLLLPVFMAHAGGWAVISVDELPDYAEAGKAVTLSFMVRQHGFTPLGDLRPSVVAASGRLNVQASVVRGDAAGRYTASLTLPKPGDWAITIKSNFGKSDLTLLPLPIVDQAAATRPVVSDIERGHRLFVAKGCVTCHAQIGAGPPLEGKRFDATYLASFLANPPKRESNKPSMPNPGLQPREIASLVNYLNGSKQVTGR